MICVDNYRMRKRVGGKFGTWSHLFSDTDNWAELLAFVKKIGLQIEWRQTRDTFPTMHFDVTESKRLAAIRAGAKSITVAELGRMIMNRNSTI